ncbi:MAG: HlyD family secretion protein, partial [Burkholderiales bacterium]
MKHRIVIVAIAVAIAIVAAYALQSFNSNAGNLRASGTIEARNIEVGSREGGRITEILVREGDRVEAGQLLLTFDDAELEGRVIQARGNVELARANLAKMEHGSRPEEIAEARAAAGSDGADGFRIAEIAQSGADLEIARAELVNAERGYERAQELREDDTVSQELLDDAETKYRTTKARVEALEHAVTAARRRMEAARAVTSRVEKGFRSEDIAAARAELTRAEGELRQAEARSAEQEVHAPNAAVVEVLDLRPGDLVAPGVA